MTVTHETVQRGPTDLAQRALGPDLARGFMLLFIALANTHYFLTGASVLGGYPQDGSPLDRVVTWLVATFVDGRSFPLFALLFGYGVAQIVRRQTGSPRDTRRLLRRRSLVLIGIGLVDGFLFYVGDILALYGVLLFLGLWVVRLRDRWLLLIAVPFLVLNTLPGGGSLSTNADPPDRSMLPPDLLAQFADRGWVVAYIALLGPIGFAVPFLLGLMAGRRRLLEHPAQHRRLLRTVAVVGVGVSVLGAQPVSLLLSGVLARPDEATLAYLGPLHDLTGLFGGCGYAALLVLLADRLRADGPLTRAVAATGQRSLTCYLVQSVTWWLVFTPYLLDLSGVLSITATALLATATWLLTVLLADRMRRAGHRGPFEVLVRRATYGSVRRDAPARPPLLRAAAAGRSRR
jgi:uncharacterized protein